MDSTVKTRGKTGKSRTKEVEKELKNAFRRNSYKMQPKIEKKREKKCRIRNLENMENLNKLDHANHKNTQKTKRNKTINKKISKKNNYRRRKTADEIVVLEKCFCKDEEWTKETVEFIKINTQLSYTQIYKWGWDQKKKCEKNQNSLKIPTIDEFGGYCKFQKEDNKLLSNIAEIDWNKEVQDLDIECEKEETKLLKSQSELINKDIQFLPNQSSVILNPANAEFSTPLKKLKRDRNFSSATNETNSQKLTRKDIDPILSSISSLKLNPFVNELYFRDYTFEAYNISNVDKFCYDSFDGFSEEISSSIANNAVEFVLPDLSELEDEEDDDQLKKHCEQAQNDSLNNEHCIIKHSFDNDFEPLFHEP